MPIVNPLKTVNGYERRKPGTVAGFRDNATIIGGYPWF